MKKIIVFGIIVLILTGFLINHSGANAEPSHTAIFVAGQMTYTADGLAKAMDAETFIENDRAFVPVRYLALALGIPGENIVWSSSSQTVTLSDADVTVSAAVDGSTLYVNEQPLKMDVAPLLRDGRTYLPARYIAEAFGYTVDWHQATQSVLIGPAGNLPQPSLGEAALLPAVGSYENLKELLENSQVRNGAVRDVFTGAVNMPLSTAQESKAAGAPEAASDSSAADYSRTNVQVEGVDEADIVKTDGSYIYQVNRERIIIAKAYPPENMSIISTLDYANKSFSPTEIYVDDTYLVVIGSTSRYYPPLYKIDSGVSSDMMPYYYQGDNVKAIIYNIEDKSNIKQVRELELSGSYVSSRKTGNSLYLIANKNIYFYPGREIGEPKPMYRDTAAGSSFVEIDYPDIKCFPDFTEPSYLIVAGLNLDNPGEAASVSSYLGSGQNIYASTENLYVAVTSYNYHIWQPVVPLIAPEIWPSYDTSKTRIYKFGMDDGRLTYKASGEVPGTILNQFSMDEYAEFFRIATTSGEVWRSDEFTSKNNVYVLDSSLNIAGKIEGIAPGEQIYSVRFAGGRAYMVTFKTVDPFFVLDLRDPYNPAILGALKIPGYSDYLHPYDENHIIGFGKDTVEMGTKGWGGDSMAFYMGMKMAIFDVSDVSSPVQMFTEKIGDRGTDSELLRNHKALLFSRDKNLLSFPVRVMEVQGSTGTTGMPVPEYGTFSFQGAYVYNIDLVNGFALKGRITHLTSEDYLKAGNYWYNSDRDIQRILYINDTLYTLSQGMIKANSLSDLTELNKVEVK
jgi:uncharacterized secreted protein with C-terminal beta-propeller domain